MHSMMATLLYIVVEVARYSTVQLLYILLQNFVIKRGTLKTRLLLKIYSSLQGLVQNNAAAAVPSVVIRTLIWYYTQYGL